MVSSVHLVLSGVVGVWMLAKRRRRRYPLGIGRRLGSLLLLFCSVLLILAAHDEPEESSTQPKTFHELWEHLWGKQHRAAHWRGEDTSSSFQQQAEASPPQQQGQSQWSQRRRQQSIAEKKGSPLHPVHHPATRKRRNWLLAHALQLFYSHQVTRQLQQGENETDDIESHRQQVVSVYQGVFDFFLHRHVSPIREDEARQQDGGTQPSHHHHEIGEHHRGDALPTFPQERFRANRELIRDMFTHSYDSYMRHGYYANTSCTTDGKACRGQAAAWGEVRPLSCQPHEFDLVEIPALTLLDSVDTLLVLGNATEFARATERLRALNEERAGLFAIDRNVSVFETTIRVLGSCLSAHQLALAFLESSSSLEMNPPKLQPPRLDDVFDGHGNVRWGDEKEEPEVTATSSASTSSVASDPKPDQQVEVKNYREPTRTSAHDEMSCPATAEYGEGATPRYVASSSPCSDECTLCTSSSLSPLADSPKNTTKLRSTTTSSSAWQYDGFYLELALDLGRRLLPAFDTETGIPYGTVNLISGVPLEETTVASLAGSGTLVLEFELLSRLTGDPSFGQAAQLAARALWHKRNRRLQLLGKHIDVQRGVWTESLSGVGSNSDSYLEYLVKAYTLFPEDDDYWPMARSVYSGLHEQARIGDWYVDVDMHHGQRHSSRKVFESLMAFYPGMQVLLGELTPAARTLNSFFLVRELVGFLPERFHFGSWTVDSNGISGASKHPLRPELLESCYFLHRATKDLRAVTNQSENVTAASSSDWLWAADFSLHRLASASRAPCGYASIKDLRPDTSGRLDGSKEGIKFHDEMPSFFLSETLKYLYLTFDDGNLLHTDAERDWIFTTEAHPIHFVPKLGQQEKGTGHSKGSGTDPFGEEKEMVKSMLRAKLKGDRPKAPPLAVDQGDEKWTETISRDSYRMDLEEFQAAVKQTRDRSPTSVGGTLTDLVKDDVATPLFHWRQHVGEMDTFNESQGFDNAAHLTFGDLGMGTGAALRKACPNLHSSDLLWIHAVNGGVVDYTDSFLSKMSDDGVDLRDDYPLVGAADALGLFGTGLYVRSPSTTDGCSVNIPKKSKDDDVVATPEDVGVIADEIIAVGLEFGNFEVSLFPNGGGFYLRHVDSGETTVTTFFADSDDDGRTDKVFLMAYSTNPDRSSALDDDEEEVVAALPLVEAATSESVAGSEPPSNRRPHPTRGVTSDKTLVVADFEENSFTCEVEIRQTLDSDEEHVTVIPCAHGLFGQTHLSRLISSNGVSVQGTIAAPQEGNEYGCAPREDRCMAMSDELSNFDGHAASSSCRGDEGVQIVRRGSCSFFDKASNHRSAPAVIVMNTEEDDLFVMSHSPEEGDDSELPVTVLVTSADGEDLISAPGARVHVRVQRQIFPSAETQAYDRVQWPIVRGSPRHLYLFGRSGWGLQATHVGEQWQLELFQHSLGTGQSDTE